MVNYSLEEFKAWLAEKPERKEGLTEWWKITSEKILKDLVEKIHDTRISGPRFNTEGWDPYRQVFLKWKAKVDQREREREQIPGREEITW